jgi:hypothetical protein
MPIRLTNVRLPVEAPETQLPQTLAQTLGLPADALASWRILRKSLDTRDKRAIQFVYSAEVVVPDADPAPLGRVGPATSSRRADRAIQRTALRVARAGHPALAASAGGDRVGAGRLDRGVFSRRGRLLPAVARTRHAR